jgi:DNA-binding transcriptional ArsR family regulator
LRSDELIVDNAIDIAKALSDESRARTLMFLRGGELCVCQIIEMLGLAPSTVSRHMNVLQRAGLVTARKDGRWIYYGLPGKEAPAEVTGALRWLEDTLRSDPRVRDDRRRVRKVRCADKEKLCNRYRS